MRAEKTQAKPAGAGETMGRPRTRRDATQGRKPWPRGGKWTSADLTAACCQLLEDSLRVCFADIEATALERLQTWDQEGRQSTAVRDCAREIEAALSRAEGLVEKHPHCPLAPIVQAFAGTRKATKTELDRLAWRPQRERAKPLTRAVEALDRTHFLGVVDRPATDQEFAALLFCLGMLSAEQAQLKSPMRAVLKQATDAIAKSRRENGRPAIIDRWRANRPALPAHARVLKRRYL